MTDLLIEQMFDENRIEEEKIGEEGIREERSVLLFASVST